MGQKVNPHGLRVGVIGTPAGLHKRVLLALHWLRITTFVTSFLKS